MAAMATEHQQTLAQEGDPAAPIRFSVRLDGGIDPIEGRLESSDGTMLPFAGWLALMSAIDIVRGAPEGSSTSQPTAITAEGL